MAILLSQPPFVGSKHGFVIWKQWGEYYVRTRSTLSSKRVKTAPEFKKTMQFAGYLAKASPIASRVYKDWLKKEKGDFRILTGAALSMIKNGMNEEEVEQNLRKIYKKFLKV